MFMTPEKKSQVIAAAHAKGLNLYYCKIAWRTTRNTATLAIAAENQADAFAKAEKQMREEFPWQFKRVINATKQ